MDTAVKFVLIFCVHLVVPASVYHYEYPAPPGSVFEEINIPAQVNQIPDNNQRADVITTSVNHFTSEDEDIQNGAIKTNDTVRKVATSNSYIDMRTSSKAVIEGTNSAKNITPAPAALGANIQKLFSHPEVKKLLNTPDSDKRYLVIYPNGTMERVKDVETLKQKYTNYVLINTNRNTSSVMTQTSDGIQVPPIESIRIQVKGDSSSPKEIHYEIPFSSINDDISKNESKPNIKITRNSTSIPHQDIQIINPIYTSTTYQTNNTAIEKEDCDSSDQKNNETVISDDHGEGNNVSKTEPETVHSNMKENDENDECLSKDSRGQKKDNVNKGPNVPANATCDNDSSNDISKMATESYDVYAIYFVNNEERNNTMENEEAEEHGDTNSFVGKNIGSMYNMADSNIVTLDGWFDENAESGNDGAPDMILFFFVPSSDEDK